MFYFLFSVIGLSETVVKVSEGGVLQVCLTLMSAPGGSLGSALSTTADDLSKSLTQDLGDWQLLQLFIEYM